nr:hypothetical protein [Tanacetum cinerariifolium]
MNYSGSSSSISRRAVDNLVDLSGETEVMPNRLLVYNSLGCLKVSKATETIVLTKPGRFPVNAARQNFTSQAASTSTATKVNTARPKANAIRPKHNVYKSHSPIQMSFNRTTAPKANFAQHKFNTARDKSVSAIEVNGKLLLRPQQVVIKDTKDITGTEYMIGNKAYLVEYQDFNGGLIAFGGSKGQITGKGKIKTRKLDFKDVYFVKELQHFNLFSVSQMCDKKNKNIIPSGGLACLIVKDTVDESTKWHMRMTIPVLLVTKESNTRPPIKNELNIKEGNFNKLDDLVGEGADYTVNKGRLTNKIKVLNAKEEGISAAGETLSNATLAVSTFNV